MDVRILSILGDDNLLYIDGYSTAFNEYNAIISVTSLCNKFIRIV